MFQNFCFFEIGLRDINISNLNELENCTPQVLKKVFYEDRLEEYIDHDWTIIGAWRVNSCLEDDEDITLAFNLFNNLSLDFPWLSQVVFVSKHFAREFILSRKDFLEYLLPEIIPSYWGVRENFYSQSRTIDDFLFDIINNCCLQHPSIQNQEKYLGSIQLVSLSDPIDLSKVHSRLEENSLGSWTITYHTEKDFQSSEIFLLPSRK